jgi:transposase
VPFIYLPPCSPEPNPIEEAFSKIKHDARKYKPRRAEALIDVLTKAIKTVTEDDVTGYANYADEFL